MGSKILNATSATASVTRNSKCYVVALGNTFKILNKTSVTAQHPLKRGVLRYAVTLGNVTASITLLRNSCACYGAWERNSFEEIVGQISQKSAEG